MHITEKLRNDLLNDKVQKLWLPDYTDQTDAIDGDDAAIIVSALKNNKKLTEIRLALRSVTHENYEAIFDALKVNRTITSIDINHNLSLRDPPPIPILSIAELLHDTTCLKELNLGSNALKDADATILAQGLKSNHTLSRLNLYHNHIHARGAQAIAESLKNGPPLRRLNLSCNPLSDVGATAIAELLKNNASITDTEISNVGMGFSGLDAISSALKINSTVTKLDLSYNKFNDDCFKSIGEALKVNSALNDLDLNGTGLGDTLLGNSEQGVHHLSDGIATNRSLMRLRLNDDLSTSNMRLLAKGIHSNRSLTELIFNNNNKPVPDPYEPEQLCLDNARIEESQGYSAISDALKDSKNILLVFPTNREVRAICKANQKVANNLIDKLMSSNPNLTRDDLQAIKERIHAIIMMCQYRSTSCKYRFTSPYFDSAWQKNKENIAVWLDKAQKQGQATGIKIELPAEWQKRVDAMGVKLSRSSNPPPFKPDKATTTLTRLQETKPDGRTNLQIFAEQGQLADIFTAAIWQGRREEMDKAWELVPTQHQSQINIELVRAQIGVTEGRARFSTGTDDRAQGF